MMWYYGYPGSYSWWPMSIMMILFWVLIIIAIVWAVRYARGDWHHDHRHEDKSLDILRERYAKGEITKAEYEKTKEDLMK